MNMRLLIPGKLEGIGWFSYECMLRITLAHPEVQFIFVYDRAIPKEFNFPSNVKHHRILLPARRPMLWRIWFQGSLKRLLKKWKPDLFYSPEGMMPLGMNIKTLTTIHDLNFEHFPEDMPARYLNFYREFFPKYAEQATRITTVSMASRNDLVNHYRVDPNKIDVVYNGVGDDFFPLNETEKEAVRTELTEAKAYFVYVGSFHRRKNIKRMLLAYESYRERGGKASFVLVGEPMWSTGELEGIVAKMKYRNDLILTGRKSQKDLTKIVAAAQALIFVSYFEGFGIPIIEGMKAGVPVLTSDVSCMPEISGGAALLVNPLNEKLIADGMLKLEDQELRIDLINKGLFRAREFSWSKTAEGIWDSMLRTIDA